MKRLLVTGGSGFIGSHFVRLFLMKHTDAHVVNLDKLTYSGNPENLRDVEQNAHYRFIHADICDEGAAEKAMEGVDAVVHFAAETHVDRSIGDPSPFIHTNIKGTSILLEKARRLGIKRFVLISTDEVYGSIEKGSFDESAAVRPNSPYSASKAGADLLARSYWVTYGLPVIVIRSTNNFGPYQYPEKIMPLFITNLIEGKKVPLYSKGENVRDWIHVEDNCRAIEFLLERGGAGEIYNVSGVCELTNLELTRKILRYFSKSDDWIDYVPDRPGHDLRYSMTSQKLKRLGFEPAISFSEGLSQTVEWYRNHRDWWTVLKKDRSTLKT